MTKSQVISQIVHEIKDFENNTVELSDYTEFNQYQKVQEIKTHQNGGFFSSKPKDQDRESFDIITPMVKTAVSNADLDSKHMEAYTDRDNSELLEIVGNSLIKQYQRQLTEGVRINQLNQLFFDDGNIVARRDKSGYVYDIVDLRNLYVIDQTARTLEDTVVIEKQYLNNTELRKMTEWKNIDQVEKYCNYNSDSIPYYEVFKRYGEITRRQLNMAKAELFGEEHEDDPEEDEEYVNALVIMAKRVKKKDSVDINDRQGVLVFAEELKPRKIKITEQLEVIYYKPYVEGHLGMYSGRWLRKGYREIGIPYQNFANKIGNKLYNLIDHFKFLYITGDKKLTGSNIFSNIKDGQIIYSEGGSFQVLNNQYPNLAALIEQWNWNINEAQKALKAFEAASGEQLPASVTATAANVQSEAIGKYYDFAREELGLFYAALYKRFIIPELFEKTKAEEKIKIGGSPELVDRFAEYKASSKLIREISKAAINGIIITKQQSEEIKDTIKRSILSEKKHFQEINKELLEDAELYLTINTIGEMHNKQEKVQNGLQIVRMLHPESPKRNEILAEVMSTLGYNVSSEDLQPQEQPMMAQQQGPGMRPGRTRGEMQAENANQNL
jgi:hypothetical protein